MRQLPDPAIYEEEFRTTPWGAMIDAVVREVKTRTPCSGSLVDLMCGPGYLINKLAQERYDLNLFGIDSDTRFIDFARRNYRSCRIGFIEGDVFDWAPALGKDFDVITCTAGVHHLPYDKQEPFLAKVVDILTPDGVALIGDPYISDYNNELERRFGASELGDAFTTAAIRGGACDDVVKAAIDVMYNDIFGHEYKTSVRKMRPLLKKYFRIEDERFTWRPDPSKEYGDCLFILKKKGR